MQYNKNPADNKNNPQLQVRSKNGSYLCNRLWRPIGFLDVLDPTFSRPLAHVCSLFGTETCTVCLVAFKQDIFSSVAAFPVSFILLFLTSLVDFHQ
jgi:hypothetical protein